MKIIIDRFEGEYVVCEDETGKVINIPKTDMPDEAKEGEVLSKSDSGYRIEKTETEAKREKIIEKMNRLFVD